MAFCPQAGELIKSVQLIMITSVLPMPIPCLDFILSLENHVLPRIVGSSMGVVRDS
jgi:hypothetical protein